jgi:thioredoxin-like negative regulator of GroEL
MVREADFAFRQACAVCPYSPEAVFRYANFLIAQKRVPEAVLIAEAAAKLQPTDQFRNLVKELKKIQKAK